MKQPVTPLPTLKKRPQFLKLRQAPRFSCEDFVLQGRLDNGGTGQPLIGYTVTRKIGNSVERNRIRRRLREAAAKAVHTLEAGLANDTNAPHGGLSGEMVVVARRGALDAPFQSLIGNFTKGIDRLVAKSNKAH